MQSSQMRHPNLAGFKADSKGSFQISDKIQTAEETGKDPRRCLTTMSTVTICLS